MSYNADTNADSNDDVYAEIPMPIFPNDLDKTPCDGCFLIIELNENFFIQRR